RFSEAVVIGREGFAVGFSQAINHRKALLPPTPSVKQRASYPT
ncbi:MAG: hypothetical protein ACJA2W_000949, partial [Planctomycetota bacterium]